MTVLAIDSRLSVTWASACGEQRVQRVGSTARFGEALELVGASWQQLKCAGETWTNADCAEIPAIRRQNPVHASSLSNGEDRPIDQSQIQLVESGVELKGPHNI